MKIGFDAKRYYHNHTGLGNYSRTLVHDLQRLFPGNDYVLYDEKSFGRTFRLGHKAAAEGCDIFHGLSNEIPLDITSQRGIKSIVTIHDVAWRTFPDMYHLFDRHMYDLKYGYAARHADVVVCISESTKRDVMRFYGVPEERTRIIYQPVNTIFYNPITTEEADRRIAACPQLAQLPAEFILNVGSINSRKNLMGIVKALSLMPADQRPPLVVIGNGREYRREVERYIAEHGLEKYVMILGNVADTEVLQALYKKASVMVYPSFYEGFGLPVVEAALQRTPVITSTVSSLPEAAGQDACLIDPHAADASEQMAHHINRLLTDSEGHKKMGQSIERYARQCFDPDLLTRKMMNLYESLCR